MPLGVKVLAVDPTNYKALYRRGHSRYNMTDPPDPDAAGMLEDLQTAAAHDVSGLLVVTLEYQVSLLPALLPPV